MVNYGTSSALSALIIADAPLLYWKLDEASGQFADSSGNGRASTVNTGLTRSQPPLSAEAGAGVACAQTGGSYATIPDAVALDATTPSFEIIFKTSNTSNIQHLCGKYGASAANQAAMIRIVLNGDVQMIFRTDTVALTTYVYTPPVDLRDGKAHHLVMTYDPTPDELKLYIDGDLVKTQTVAGTRMYDSTGAVGIGSVGQTLQGAEYLDEFAYYGTVLTATQVKNHYWASGVGTHEWDTAVTPTYRASSIFTPAAVVETDTPLGTFVERGYAKAVIQDSPLIYYRLNDAGGGGTALLDSSGHGWSGLVATGTSAPTAGAASLLISDPTNKAFSFDGTDNISRASSGTNMYAARANESIEAWIKTSTINAAVAPIVGVWGSTSSNKRIRIQLTTSGFAQAICRINAVADYTVTGAVDLRDGQAHHIVATMLAGDALRLYVDGVEVANTAISAGTTQAAGDSLRAGVTGSGETASNFTGIIDEIAYYDNTLSSTRVAAHYSAGITGPAQSINAGTPVETETAVAATVSTRTYVNVGIATESDATVLPSAALGALTVAEADSPIQTSVLFGALAVAEADAALAATSKVDVVITPTVVVETETPIAAVLGILVGAALETEGVVNPFIRAGYAAAVLADTPIAYYRLDEPAGSGVAVDQSGYGNDAEYYYYDNLGPTPARLAEPGDPTPYPVTGLLARDGNPARKFTATVYGTNDAPEDGGYMLITPGAGAEWTADASVSNRPGPRTVEFWLRVPKDYPDSYASGHSIFGVNYWTGSAFASAFGVILGSDGHLYIDHDHVTTPVFGDVATGPLDDGRSHHIVLAYDDSPPPGGPGFDDYGIYFYCDGLLVGAYEAELTSVLKDRPWRLDIPSPLLEGSDYVFHWDDPYDEIAIYNYALPASRVWAHWMEGGWIQAIEEEVVPDDFMVVEGRYGRVVIEDDPLIYWRIGGTDDSGDSVKDYSRSGAFDTSYHPSSLAADNVDGLVSGSSTAVSLAFGAISSLLDLDDSEVVTHSAMEGWFQLSASGGTFTLMCEGRQDAAPDSGNRVVLEGTTLRVRYRSNDVDRSFGVVYPGDGEPHYIAATWDEVGGSLTARLYIDGVPVASQTVAGPLSVHDQFSVGVYPPVVTSAWMTGIVDEVAYYRSELTPERIFVHWMMGSELTAVETDVALPAAYNANIPVGVATEVETTIAGVFGQAITAGVAVETAQVRGYHMPTLLSVGNGTLSIDSEGFVTIPEFKLVVLDDEIKRAPQALVVSLAGAVPDWDVSFYIDGTLVWTTPTDSDGNLPMIALNITPTVGGAVGDHTVEARQTLPDSGTVIVSVDSFNVLRPPVQFPSTMGADAEPVEVPGALVGDVRHWVWQDLLPEADGGIGSWIMPINPREMTSPHYEHSFASRHTTSKTGQYHVSQAIRAMVEWSFGGYAPNKAYVDKLLAYGALNRRFYIIDHHNRAWKVVISEVEVIPRLRQTFNGVQDDWGSDWKVTVTIVEQDYLTPEVP